MKAKSGRVNRKKIWVKSGGVMNVEGAERYYEHQDLGRDRMYGRDVLVRGSERGGLRAT